MKLYTRSMAFSRKIPRGCPFSSTSKRPPSGCGVLPVTPVISSAREFTTQAWPQARTMQMGTSLDTWSKS